MDDTCRNKYNDELYYHVFVLSYDLLHNRLVNDNISTDIAYDVCNSIAKHFLDSEEYKNLKYSSYEMLEYWLRDNKDLVNSYFKYSESKGDVKMDNIKEKLVSEIVDFLLHDTSVNNTTIQYLIDRKQKLNEEIDDIIYSDMGYVLKEKELNQINDIKKEIQYIYELIGKFEMESNK